MQYNATKTMVQPSVETLKKDLIKKRSDRLTGSPGAMAKTFSKKLIVVAGFVLAGLVDSTYSIANRLYVNDGSTTGDHYTTAIGDDNNPGTAAAPFATINNAIGTALPGDTIYVDAGTYREEYVFIYQQLTIIGSNYGIDPNTGTRLAESIVQPLTSDAVNGVLVYIDPEAAGSRLDGFTLDGDNTTVGGGSASNGADINTAYGIYAYDLVANDTINNNIIQNMGTSGAFLYDSANAVAGTGNQVSHNKFDNILLGSGTAILLYNNAYTNITDNVMTGVRTGVQTGNFYRADLGNSHTISNNTIQSQVLGIWTNLHYANASTFNVTNNTLTNYPGAATLQSIGIRVQSIQGTTGVQLSSNNVTGNKYGVALTNCPTTNTITVSGGVLSGNNVGVFATNSLNTNNPNASSSSYAISGVSIQNALYAGIEVADTSLTTNNSTVALSISSNTVINNTTTGLLLQGANASATFSGATPAAFTGQTIYINQISNGNTVPATNINATAVSFDGQTGATATPAQNFAIEDKINHKIDLLPLGFITVKAANTFVTDIAPLAPTATNNDYTRVRNGILSASSNWTINHTGTFNWTETNAASSWALGNDGVNNTADDYSILIPNNLNGVTFTTPATITPATIQGPGDLPGANLEGVLVFDGTVNQNWTISNMKFQDFDLSIGMFSGAGGTDAFDNTIITNNFFRIPKDLNAVVAPADVNQNIGIHYSFGSNQTISNNTFEVDGTGAGSGTSNSTSIVMQSNTSGGATTYDGLKIINNTITVTGVPDATTPAVIRGIWENSQSTGAAIEISSNVFTNAATGNTATLNRQTAFWVTSNSDATKKVEYKNNEVSGFRDGIAWLGGSFTTNTPPDYNTGETPTEIMNNKFNGVQFGVVVRKSGASTNPGSPALINFNSFTNTPSDGYAISNEGTGTTNATCNWYGTIGASAIAALINGPVTYSPYLLDGTDNDPATRGFQTSATCGRAHELYVNDNSQTGDHYTTAIGNDNNPGTPSMPFATITQAVNSADPGDTIYVDAGRYTEEYVFFYQKQTIRGSNYGIDPNTGTRLAESIVQPLISDPANGVLVYIAPEAAGSRLDGFTLDGDNTDSTSNVTSNGADINTAYGIYAYTDSAANIISNDTINNNIIKNMGANGAFIYADPNGQAGTGNLISHNKFDNILLNAGTATLLYNNVYTNVTDNVMTRVRTGVQTGNFYRADPGNSHTIGNNTIQSQVLGIWTNLHYANASTFNVTNNTLTSYPSMSPVQSIGLRVQSINDAVGVNVSNNNITGNKYGVALTNCPTTNTITVNGGTLSGNTVGVFATNSLNTNNINATSSAYIINGVNIQNALYAGIEVADTSTTTNGSTVSVSIRGNTVINNTTTGLLLQGANASAAFSGATPATFTGQTTYIDQVSNGNTVPATNIDATAVSFDGQTGATATAAQNFAIEDKINHKIENKNLGFVTVKALNVFVTDINAPVTPTNINNDFTRLRNGIISLSNNWTINNRGSFDWTEPYAAASWAAGSNDIPGTRDDYALFVPNNLNGVTFTAPQGLGTATIHGPGDLPNVDLENVLTFDAGPNKNWTISNMIFDNFDLSVGMFSAPSAVTDKFNNTTITNNIFNIANDLNATVAPADVSQNLGIYYSLGANQTFSNNTFNVPGNGVSSGANLSSIVVMQCTNSTTSTTVYDGLQIQNNTINIVGAQSANPSSIVGIWELGYNQNAAINISGNKYISTTSGNNPALNMQTAFRVTSASGASKNVVYQNNEVTGANRVFEWASDYSYPSGATPVQLLNNKVDSTVDAVVVRTNGASAMVNNNSFTRTGEYAIKNEASTGTTNATCNWYGTTVPAAIAAKINGAVTYVPYLNDGTDAAPATTGFQPAASCAACTTITATVTPTDNLCNGGNSGKVTVTNVTGGAGPYTFTIAGPTVNTTGATSGVFTGLTAGSYTVTVFGGSGCSTAQAPVTVGQPSGTAPDANLNIAAASSYFFPTPMTVNTYVYQIFESAGNPITGATLRITKQNGYTYSFNTAATSTTVNNTNYPVDNTRWTPDNTDPNLYFVRLNAGNQINCQSVVNLEVKITRNTANKANFSVTSLLFQVPGETDFSTNFTTFQAVGN